MIDLPTPGEISEPESWEDVTTELSRLIAVERPRRQPTQPPPVPARTSAPRVAETLVGDWRLGFELGRGGMGAVHAVSHREFGKRAALKLSHESEGLGARVFHREARIVQLVDHPAMPDVFATGFHEARPYLVMERLRGRTVTQLLDDGVLDRETAFALLIELCDVLAAAHDAGVVHRDLKPDNVFVLEPATTPRIKLLDWGFSYVLGEADPLRGMIAGTLSYVAPEQALGGAITPATDVYSLGVLAYRLILGQSPFSASSDAELVCRHIQAAPPHPAMLWPGIPRALAERMIAMLAKEPLARPSLAEVRATLETAQAPPRRRLLTPRSGIAPLPERGTFKQRALGGAATVIACAGAAAAAILST